MKEKKRILAPTLLVLIITLIIAVIPTEAHGAIYEDTIRLHILANSDSEEDQELKIELRDRILERFSLELTAERDITSAQRRIELLLPKIKAEAEKFLSEKGYAYSVSVRLDEEWFDTRDYGSFSFPSGTYKSLIIEIGEAEGRNWWCVMFPPMCTEIATSDAIDSYSDAEKSLILGGKYRAKFKTLELLRSVISK